MLATSVDVTGDDLFDAFGGVETAHEPGTPSVLNSRRNWF